MQGEGLAILNGSTPYGVSSKYETAGKYGGGLPSSMSSSMGLLSSETYRPPLHPLSVETVDMAANKRYTTEAWGTGGALGSGSSGALSTWTTYENNPPGLTSEPLRSGLGSLSRPSTTQDPPTKPSSSVGSGLGLGAGSYEYKTEYKRTWSAPASGRENNLPLSTASAAPMLSAGAQDVLNLTPTKQLARQMNSMDLLPKPPGALHSQAAPAPASSSRALTDAASSLGGGAGSSSSSAGAPALDGEDAEALFTMHHNIKLVLAMTPCGGRGDVFGVSFSCALRGRRVLFARLVPKP